MAKMYIEGINCKSVNWQFGEFFNISFNIEKLKQYANEKGYVNVTMSKRKEQWQYWETHYFTLNEWTPEWKNNNSNSSSKNNDYNWEISVEDIPF
jgi:hypothetical protein